MSRIFFVKSSRLSKPIWFPTLILNSHKTKYLKSRNTDVTLIPIHLSQNFCGRNFLMEKSSTEGKNLIGAIIHFSSLSNNFRCVSGRQGRVDKSWLKMVTSEISSASVTVSSLRFSCCLSCDRCRRNSNRSEQNKSNGNKRYKNENKGSERYRNKCGGNKRYWSKCEGNKR